MSCRCDERAPFAVRAPSGALFFACLTHAVEAQHRGCEVEGLPSLTDGDVDAVLHCLLSDEVHS